MIQNISPEKFLDLVYRETELFMNSIKDNTVYVVKDFYSKKKIKEFFSLLESFRQTFEPSWHPCLDGCPDYHRINDEYPNSYVRAKMHSYYFHRWNRHRDVFDDFKDVFEIKNYLAGQPKGSFYDTIPSEGVISRIVSHQYPRGGGYLKEHVDPTSSFAKIQTIILASGFGKDYHQGGLYLRKNEKSDPIPIDPHAEIGDLLVLSPDVRHGVAAIDPNEPLDWSKTDGRWMILPIIIRSDYNQDPSTKPKEA